MGSDLTVFLEFYGLPGSGKSEVSHLVAEYLRQMGKTVSEPSYEADHVFEKGKRKLWKLCGLFRLIVFHPLLYWNLVRQIAEAGCKGRDFSQLAVNIGYKLWAYEHPRTEYVLFDEGLIQSAVSMTVYGERDMRKMRVLIEPINNKRVTMFFICAEPQTVLQRLRGRDKHDSRVEKLESDSSRLELLNRFQKQCEIIDYESMFKINTEDYSAEDAARKVIKELTEAECQL